MNVSSVGMSAINVQSQAPVQEVQAKAMEQSTELSKDLLKVQVEAMLSLGKMNYIGTLVDMYV